MINSLKFLLFVLLVSCTNKPILLDGYTNKTSYQAGEPIKVYLNALKNKTQKITLHKIGFGIIDKIETNVFPQDIKDTAYWWKNGFNYKQTFTYSSKNLTSGIYHFDNCSPFIIKNTTEKKDVLVVYPYNTVNAYNNRGGRSFYSKPMGKKLSFLRPFDIQHFAKPFLEWLPKQNFNVDYIVDNDIENYENIKNYKVIVIPGHSEYWSRKARENFDLYIENGGNAVILSGNTMWWQVRYDNNSLICYKNKEEDYTVGNWFKTIDWQDTSLHYPIEKSIGVNFTNGGYGLKKDNGWNGYKIVSNSPLLQNTNIKLGDTLHIPTAEYDGLPLIFNPNPKIDTNFIHFYKQELVGYDKGFRLKETYPSFLVFQKTKTSGIIINTASTNWCKEGFTGKDNKKIKKLTSNFIDYLVTGKKVFTN